MDKYFKVNVLSKTENPQTLCYQALHRCYSNDPSLETGLSERECGEIAVKRLLDGGRGHFGIFEAVSLTVDCLYFPHDVLAQGSRHRHASFAAQSFRYTGEYLSMIDCTLGGLHDNQNIESAFYLRPIGFYYDRHGAKFDYDEQTRQQDIEMAKVMLRHYQHNISRGMPLEQARGLLPYSIRQHFVVTLNARSLMHFLDLRSKKDAQFEIQCLSNLLFDVFKDWMPEIATWYEENRLHKAKLAP